MTSIGLTESDYDEKLREMGNYLWDLEQQADLAKAEEGHAVDGDVAEMLTRLFVASGKTGQRHGLATLPNIRSYCQLLRVRVRGSRSMEDERDRSRVGRLDRVSRTRHMAQVVAAPHAVGSGGELDGGQWLHADGTKRLRRPAGIVAVVTEEVLRRLDDLGLELGPQLRRCLHRDDVRVHGDLGRAHCEQPGGQHVGRGSPPAACSGSEYRSMAIPVSERLVSNMRTDGDARDERSR